MKKVERVFEVVTVIYRLLINKILGKKSILFFWSAYLWQCWGYCYSISI